MQLTVNGVLVCSPPNQPGRIIFKNNNMIKQCLQNTKENVQRKSSKSIEKCEGVRLPKIHSSELLCTDYLLSLWREGHMVMLVGSYKKKNPTDISNAYSFIKRFCSHCVFFDLYFFLTLCNRH